MTSITLDSTNEKNIVDYLKQMISENPNLARDIIEPTINELISDTNIPQIIKDKIQADYSQAITKEQFNQLLKEFITDLFHNEYGESYINELVNNYLNDDDVIDGKINSAIGSAIDSLDLDTSVSDAVEEKVNNIDIESDLSEAITEQVESFVNDNSGGGRFQRLINDGVTESIDSPHIQEQIINGIDEKLSNLLQAKIDGGTSDLISNKIDQLLTPDFLKAAVEKYLNDHHFIDQVEKYDDKKNVTEPGTKIISIKLSESDDMHKIVWLLKQIISEDRISFCK